MNANTADLPRPAYPSPVGPPPAPAWQRRGVISSGTNENLTENAKGLGMITIGGVSTGLVSIGRGSVSMPVSVFHEDKRRHAKTRP